MSQSFDYISSSSSFIVLIFVAFFTLGLLFFLDRFLERGGLGTDFVLLGIFHHVRRVLREVAALLRELVSAAEVDLLHLAVVEERVGTRPVVVAHDNHSVGAGLLDGGVFVVVLSFVTAEANAPARLFEFLAHRDCRVVGYAFQKWLVRVRRFHLAFGLLGVKFLTLREVSGLFRRHVAGAAVAEHVRLGIDPVGGLGHRRGAGHHERLVLLTFVGNDLKEPVGSLVFLELHDSLGDQSGRVTDPGELCPQEVLLSSEEERVRVDGPLEVASEHHLD